MTTNDDNQWTELVGSLIDGDQEPAILVVDDSAVMRGEMREILRATKLQVLEAADGEEGLALLRGHGKVLLAFLDINMPKLNGLAMAERLHDEAKAGKLVCPPLVMLTTENTKDQVIRAKRAGVVGWIIKPPKRDHILAVVAKLTKKAVAA